MFKTSRDFEAAMYTILKNIMNELPPHEKIELSEIDCKDVINKIIDLNFLDGLEKIPATSMFDHKFNKLTRITYSGLKFVENQESKQE